MHYRKKKERKLRVALPGGGYNRAFNAGYKSLVWCLLWWGNSEQIEPCWLLQMGQYNTQRVFPACSGTNRTCSGIKRIFNWKDKSWWSFPPQLVAYLPPPPKCPRNLRDNAIRHLHTSLKYSQRFKIVN